VLDWKECGEVERHAEVMCNAWVFKGTRVPVKALFENLQDGAKAHEFAEGFPTVHIDQVQAVLAFAQSSLAAA
jgi:uncharacterized protein (DUF433 family)